MCILVTTKQTSQLFHWFVLEGAVHGDLIPESGKNPPDYPQVMRTHKIDIKKISLSLTFNVFRNKKIMRVKFRKGYLEHLRKESCDFKTKHLGRLENALARKGLGNIKL